MPRPARPWFRFYVEAIHDRKLRKRPPAHRWLWVVVLACARASCEPGTLLVSELEPMDLEDLADAAALSMKDTREGVESFCKGGMLDVDDRGAWVVARWNDRQFESDDVKERTRKHRSNDDGRNVPTSPEGTPPENRGQKTDTEVATQPACATPDGAFETWWAGYPRKVDKGHAVKAFRAALKLTTVEQLTEGLERSKCDWQAEERPGDKIPHAATWLNGHRWNDEPTPITNGKRTTALDRSLANIQKTLVR